MQRQRRLDQNKDENARRTSWAGQTANGPDWGERGGEPLCAMFVREKFYGLQSKRPRRMSKDVVEQNALLKVGIQPRDEATVEILGAANAPIVLARGSRPRPWHGGEAGVIA